WDADSEIQLNYDQNAVYERLIPVIDKGLASNFLLHGVTGSGKTEIYIKLVEATIKRGRQAMILIPEISLTPQIVGKFFQRFGDRIAVFHSKLSSGQRYDQWVQVNRGEKDIVIGPRSALFSPCHKLGLIIIDESHDMAYKSDKNPKFHSRDVAFALGKLHEAPVLLGTATPSVDSLRLVEQGKVTYLSITRRYNNALLPSVDIVDMRQELMNGNKTIFSTELQQQMEAALAKGQQVMLFLNRKGYANFIKCKECGYTLKCPNCDISLTYHKYDSQGKCNYCGYYTKVEEICPECNSPDFKQFGLGTEKIEELVMERFPNYPVGRLDSVIASKKGMTEEVLRKFQSGDLSILIGTQMITKGLDFSNVTLVGVLSADILLNFPDYQSSERAFQLLTQVAGRAGRGAMKGHVVIQTYSPEHFTLSAVKDRDFNKFIQEEQLMRKTFHYPPYVKMANIVISGPNEVRVEAVANRLGSSLKAVVEKNNIEITEILGPNPALYSKIKNRYRWQIILKYNPEQFKVIRRLLKFLCIEKSDQIGLDDVSVNIDIDAVKLL
ncbi:MAG: primosomal protein N', partial [Clostridia bacterium]|nr:primosomal protein N' [Clostridia bacterium]